MSITANDGGVLRKLDAIPCNDNGVLRNQDNIKDNNGGVLREIFSAIKLPTALTWRVDKSWSSSIRPYNTSSISSTSEDGLSITYTAKGTNTRDDDLVMTILSYPVFLSAGAKVNVDFLSLSGYGKTYNRASVWLHRKEYVDAGKYDDDPKLFSYDSNASSQEASGTITIDESTEYVFMLNGESATMGPTPSYYPATVKLSISFSK